MAIMANEMGWIKNLKRTNLTIIPMSNWKRSYWLDKSEHPWVSPQPQIKTIRTNLAYVGFGLIEGSNLNDGRGTDRPYLRIGAPWLSGFHLYEKLIQLKLPGVEFRVVEYVPRKKPDDKVIPLHVNKVCSGIDIYITNPDRFDPVGAAGLCVDQKHGYVYVTFAYLDKNGVHRNGIIRYENTPGRIGIEPNSSTYFLDLFKDEISDTSHQIGPCVIHNDELYIAVGFGRAKNESQNLDSTLGSIIRTVSYTHLTLPTNREV